MKSNRYSNTSITTTDTSYGHVQDEVVLSFGIFIYFFSASHSLHQHSPLMDFKLLFFLIFHYFLTNSSIYASLPFPKQSLPTKSGSTPPPIPPFSTRSTKPKISPHLSLKPQFLFGFKVDLDVPLCLEISTS